MHVGTTRRTGKGRPRSHKVVIRKIPDKTRPTAMSNRIASPTRSGIRPSLSRSGTPQNRLVPTQSASVICTMGLSSVRESLGKKEGWGGIDRLTINGRFDKSWRVHGHL